MCTIIAFKWHSFVQDAAIADAHAWFLFTVLFLQILLLCSGVFRDLSHFDSPIIVILKVLFCSCVFCMLLHVTYYRHTWMRVLVLMSVLSFVTFYKPHPTNTPSAAQSQSNNNVTINPWEGTSVLEGLLVVFSDLRGFLSVWLIK